MGTTGLTMVSGFIFTLYCCAASASCDVSQFDRTAPSAIRGEVSNHLAHFEYASDIDSVGGRLRVWNYVLNKREDKGIGISWPKAGIGIDLWAPLPPREAACKFQTVDEVQKDPDAPITYGTKDQTQPATVYVSEQPKKLGSTDSVISASYMNDDGKSVNVDVQLSTYQTNDGISFILRHSPGVVIGIAGLPQVLTAKQLDGIRLSAKSQDASVEQATYFEYTKEDPRKALSFLFQADKGPNENTDFLFFSGSSAKFGFETLTNRIEKVSADVIVLDEKRRRPVFATDISLLVPAGK